MNIRIGVFYVWISLIFFFILFIDVGIMINISEANEGLAKFTNNFKTLSQRLVVLAFIFSEI